MQQDLFDKEKDIEKLADKEMLPLAVIKGKATGKTKSPLQKETEKYNRLVKQFSKLDKEWEEVAARRQAALQERSKVLAPLTDRLNSALLAFIKVLDHWYQLPKTLNKPDRRLLVQIVLEEVQDLHGPDAGEWRQRYQAYDWELSTPGQKKYMLEDLEDQGIDMGKSASKMSGEEFYKNLHTDANREKMYAHAQEQKQEERDIFEDMFSNFFGRFKEKKPSKKEEAHQQSVAGFLKKLYKKLARLLHPDLEQDAVVRSFKEEVMKELTEAKDKEDIYSLLALRTRVYTALAIEVEEDDADESVLLPQYKMLNRQLTEQVYEKQRRANLSATEHTQMITVNGRPKWIDSLSPEGIAFEQRQMLDEITHYTDYTALIEEAKAEEISVLLKGW